ncbi:PAS domain-containing protein [Pontibacter sp. CAU 1760]
MIEHTTPELKKTGNGKQALSFQHIFESQAGAIAVLSQQFEVQAATNAFVAETGMQREELIGKNITAVLALPPLGTGLFTQVLQASLQQVLSTREAYQLQKPLPYTPSTAALEAKTETQHRLFHHTPVLNEQGEIAYILFEWTKAVGCLEAEQDLLERKNCEEATEALQRYEHTSLRLDPLYKKLSAPVAILEGPDFVYADYNDASAQLFREKNKLGYALFDMLPELKGQEIEKILNHTYQTGETFEGMGILVPVAPQKGAEPEDRYWNLICQAIRNGSQEITGLMVFAQDVTSCVESRKEAEKRVFNLQEFNQELEKRLKEYTEELQLAYAETNKRIESYHSLFIQAPVAIAIYRGSQHIVELANPLLCQLTGRTSDELLNKPVFEVLSELKGQGIEEILADVYNEGIDFEVKEMPAIVDLNGQKHHGFYHTLYTPLRNVNNEIEGILQVAYEVTEQVTARDKAEEIADRILFMANAMPQKVWTADANGAVDYCNQQWLDYTGLSREEFIGWGWQHILEPALVESNVRVWKHCVATGEEFQLEHRLRRKDGEYRWHLTRALAQRNEKGEITMWFGTSTDIHDQKLAEESLQDLTAELSAANISIRQSNEDLGAMNQKLTHINSDLDNFIYTASHDLRAPISNIERLMEELLIELPEESLRKQEVKAITGMMSNAVDRFKKTIINLTEITKLQKGEDAVITPLNLEEIVEDVKLDLAQLIGASKAEVTIDFHGCTFITFSEKNMRSIIYNLLSNALKYKHPERVPQIEVSCREEGEFVVLRVEDNGLGIGEKHQSKLFGMFKRFHDHVEGTGVGLYMVKRIMDNTNGKIEVKSNVGEGTCFSVYFRKV